MAGMRKCLCEREQARRDGLLVSDSLTPRRLNLVTARATAATGALELAGLGRVARARLGGRVRHTRRLAEELVHLLFRGFVFEVWGVGSGGVWGATPVVS